MDDKSYPVVDHAEENDHDGLTLMGVEKFQLVIILHHSILFAYREVPKRVLHLGEEDWNLLGIVHKLV